MSQNLWRQAIVVAACNKSLGSPKEQISITFGRRETHQQTYNLVLIFSMTNSHWLGFDRSGGNSIETPAILTPSPTNLSDLLGSSNKAAAHNKSPHFAHIVVSKIYELKTLFKQFNPNFRFEPRKTKVAQLINVKRDFPTVTIIPLRHFYYSPKLLIASRAIFDKEITWKCHDNYI